MGESKAEQEAVCGASSGAEDDRPAAELPADDVGASWAAAMAKAHRAYVVERNQRVNTASETKRENTS